MWTGVISRGIAVAVVTAIVSYLTARALASRARVAYDGHLILQYPIAFRIFGPVACSLLLLLLAFLTRMVSVNPETFYSVPLIAAVDLGMGCLLIYGMFEFPVVRLDVSSEGVMSRSPWRGRRFIHWTDIASVSFKIGPQWVEIRAKDGTAIRANLCLSGIHELYLELKRRVPRTAWKDRYAPFEPRANHSQYDV